VGGECGGDCGGVGAESVYPEAGRSGPWEALGGAAEGSVGAVAGVDEVPASRGLAAADSQHCITDVEFPRIRKGEAEWRQWADCGRWIYLHTSGEKMLLVSPVCKSAVADISATGNDSGLNQG
jgi:hypothetical protein